MTFTRPGRGQGRALHLRRVRALQSLERTGLLTFHGYHGGRYVLTTPSGEERTFAYGESAAYVLGLADLYVRLRQDVDELAGEIPLDRLDDRYLDILSACLRDVLPAAGET